MAGSDELDYLKSLVAQLNDKIKVLEQKAAKTTSNVQNAVKGTPKAGGLRTILVGPPGAGTFIRLLHGDYSS
jgi:adenylate kinase